MCRVLILDDEDYSAESVQLTLQRDDEICSDICLNSRDALQAARNGVASGKPYDIFLIDQRLREVKDGIEIMLDLKKISPSSDAIIFTGFEDPEDGIRAYNAGAYRYLSKPLNSEELIFVLNALRQTRREKVERHWQTVFSEMMEKALSGSFGAVARIVLDCSLKLGFERAHLFWVPTKEDLSRQKNWMIGIDNAGEGRVTDFSGKRFKLKWLHHQHDAIIIHNLPEEIRTQVEGMGYPIPKGEWAVLPLWNGQTLRGALTLDFWQNDRGLSKHEISLLNFFARQVAVVLQHASVNSREKKVKEETEIISKIGRQVSTRAATENLSLLLEQIRDEMGQLVDVSNLAIFLYKEDLKELDFELLYENGKRKRGVRRPIKNGLEEHMLALKQEVFIPNQVKEYLVNNHLEKKGETASSWLGVPLQVGGKIIGGMVIQKFKDRKKFLPRDLQILRAAADQVAGAIQISSYSKEEQAETRSIKLLQRANMEMLQIARRSAREFWLTVLTLATSSFGLGFNRALLFLTYENRRFLRGEAGIGTEVNDDAHRDWERDEKRKYDFDAYLRDLEKGRIHISPFQAIVETINIPLNGEQDLIHAVLQGETKILQEAEIQSRLPPEIAGRFNLSTCAIAPLRAGNKVLGLVIVDNKHNQNIIDEKSKFRLLSLLDNAGLVWETVQQTEKSDKLLNATHEILATTSHQRLPETLSMICKAARKFCEADWAIIYTIRRGKTPVEFDLNKVGYDGNLHSPGNELISEQPRVSGVSSHVLRKGELVINNVDEPPAGIGRLKLSEHHFIKHEGVKALAGVMVHDPYAPKEPLGVLYLDYRKKHDFSETEKQYVRSFASLAAIAITRAQREDEQRQHKLLDTSLRVSKNINAAKGMEETLSNVLEILQTLFENTTSCILLYDEDEKALKFAPETLRYYQIKNPRLANFQSFPIYQTTSGSIACKVARMALEKKAIAPLNVPDVKVDPDYLPLNPRTRSELCVSLMDSQGRLLGVLALENMHRNFFDKDDVELVEAVAHQLGVAIEQAQRSEQLQFASSVSTMTVWAADLAHDINNEVGKIRGLAYLIQETAEDNTKIITYAEQIEESAKMLSSAGPWSTKNKQTLVLDRALKGFLEELTQQRGIGLEMNFSTKGVQVNANPAEFKRVIRHLIRNSAKAMQQEPEPRIVVTTRLIEEGQVEILFQDFGPGVDEKVRSRIFQVPISTKGRGGYGLMLTRQMVEDMGGKIKLLANEGKTGAVFSIKLPVINFTERSEHER